MKERPLLPTDPERLSGDERPTQDPRAELRVLEGLRKVRQNLDDQIESISLRLGMNHGAIKLPDDQIDFTKEVRIMYKSRRLRGNFFSKDLFADPAWDMLLELYSARLNSRTISISSLCIASDVPATTALRWIDTLVKCGLVTRTPDHFDKRRILASITDIAADKMQLYFLNLQSTV